MNRMADPPAFAIAPIDRCYMLVGLIKASWEGISGGAGVERGDRGATSTSCGRWPREPARVARGAGRSRARVPGARRHRPAARRRAGDRLRRARDRAGRAPGVRDRAHGSGDDRAGAARVRRGDAREARRAVRRRRSAGPPPRAASCGTRPTRSCPRSRARPPSACAVPATFDMEVASVEVPVRRCRTARCRWRSTSTGRCTTAATTGRLQMSLIPWSCSAEFRLPVATWRDLIEHYYPSTGWIALREETLLALQREKAERALPTLDACVAELLGSAVSVDELGRLAALRGLRAVPVHAGRDEERDADAVRHRLSAGVRRGRSTRPTTTSSCSACVEGDGEITAEVRFLLPSGERHQARAAARSPAPASSSSARSRSGRALAREPAGDGRRKVSLPGREPHRRARPGSTAAEALAPLAHLDPPDPACDGRRAVRLASWTLRATA